MPVTANSGGQILVLCTANVCRSPMAAALLASRLAAHGVSLPVWSAGALPGGHPALPEAVAVMTEHGIDISGHLSRELAPKDLSGASLVLGMAREHVRHAAVMVPDALPCAFTLKEIVRRAGLVGPRPADEPLDSWLSRLNASRSRKSLLGGSPSDDVPDPAGGQPRGYAETAALLERLVGQLVGLCWGAD